MVSSAGKILRKVERASPVFLQRCDSIGVKGWGYAKDVILWELARGQVERFESWKVCRLRKEDKERAVNVPSRSG